jgi:hypothetical protein
MIAFIDDHREANGIEPIYKIQCFGMPFPPNQWVLPLC